MRRPFAALVAAAVVVASGWGDAEPAAARQPVAVFSRIDGGAQILARLAPGSLRPGRPRLRLGEYHELAVFRPSASRTRATEIVRARTGALLRTVARPPRGYSVSILSSPLGSGELPR